jgi:Arc-like DNA binding dprotein
MARKTTELRPLMTRIPEGLRRRLEHAAKKADRSMNGEIIARLAESFEREDQEAVFQRYLAGVRQENDEHVARVIHGMLGGLIKGGALPARGALSLNEIRTALKKPDDGDTK